MDQYIGKLLDNRYELLELIGVGGMARVYKARCHRLNRLVAVKILRDDLAQDAELRRRFHDESQAVAMLSHPNIVAVYDVSRTSELEYIVMELIDGVSLKQYMQKKGNKLNWREALHFITQIVKALGHAHSRGIIHRDIKPHNIMVLRDGSVKVADFGIARVASGGHSTLTQEALGSVHYISPEQARGSHIDARSDLYSAGVVLYEMITGRLPFEGDTPVSVAIQHINSIPLSPREIDPTIPEALEAITMKAMAPNPDNRYASADAMLADLEEFRKNPNINFDYHASDFQGEEPDDGDKTQVRVPIPAAHRGGPSRREQDRPGRPAARRREEAEEEDEEPPHRPNWPIIGAVIAILVFVGALLFIMFSSLFSNSLQPHASVAVPSVTGKLFDEVKDDTQLLGDFTLVQSGSQADDRAAGTILSQDPAANSTVSGPDRTIRVVVSSGPEEDVLMPDVTGQSWTSALSQLQGLDLDLNVDYSSRTSYSDTVPKDSVISTVPEEGQVLVEGQKVILEVSLGKAEAPVTMMDLRGMTLDAATKAITGLGLTLGTTDYSSSSYSEGQVWFQSVEPQTEVAAGTKVNIIISTGPEGGGTGSGGQASKTVSFALPDAGDVVSVAVIDQDGNTVYGPQDVDTNMETAIDVPVSGSGTQTFTLMVNGSRYSTQTVDFDS